LGGLVRGSVRGCWFVVRQDRSLPVTARLGGLVRGSVRGCWFVVRQDRFLPVTARLR
jgi:hypothetical protein